MTTTADRAATGRQAPISVSVPDQTRISGLLHREQRLAERHPSLYPVAVRANRARRRIQWMLADTTWASTRQPVDLPVRVRRHKSLLLRQLGESEMHLQHNKVTNLRIAAACVDGLLVRPGETFSFNKVVGNCTRRRGFVEGMRLSNGAARTGIGGGICQLANLIHWMALHSGLTVTERSEHSFDPLLPPPRRPLPGQPDLAQRDRPAYGRHGGRGARARQLCAGQVPPHRRRDRRPGRPARWHTGGAGVRVSRECGGLHIA